MKIITITLNPAFDIHCHIDDFKTLMENYATAVSKDAGGKGVNISRALCQFDVLNTALCVVGSLNGKEFLSELEKDGMATKSITVNGRIRENITVHSNNGETRISFEGFSLSDGIYDELIDVINAEFEEDMVVTFTGRLCKGLSKSATVKFLSDIKSIGAKLIVDCNSFTLDELAEIKPYLIKPNEQEISTLSKITSQEDILAVTKNIHSFGIDNVMVSLGSDGFVFCSDDGAFKVDVPKVSAISTIGAGDSTIAGFIYAMAMEMSIEDTLKMAAAFGTSACLEEGTKPPQKETVLKIFNDVTIRRI